MKKLSLNEGIGVSVALVAALGLLFFGNYIFGGAKNVSSGATATQKAQEANVASAVTTNAIRIDEISAGTGQAVKAGDTISVHYIGALAGGGIFDSSYDRGQPISFVVGAGQLIKGFDQGVVGMQVGGKRKITIPPELGYGTEQIGPIPPNSTLVFEVELVSVK